MRRNLSRLRQLSRTKIITGVLVLGVVAGGTVLGVYAWQGTIASNRTLDEVNSSIDKKIANQLLGQSPSEKDIAGMSQPSTETTPTTETSQSNKNPSPSPQPLDGSSSNSPVNTQKAAPSTETSTSPTYPNDNGDTPQVTLTNPSAWKQVVSGSFTATAVASDSSGINRVVFMLRKIGQAMPVQMITDTDFPYSAVIDVSSLPNGDSDYTIEAQAFDNTATGNLASYRIHIKN